MEMRLTELLEGEITTGKIIGALDGDPANPPIGPRRELGSCSPANKAQILA